MKYDPELLAIITMAIGFYGLLLILGVPILELTFISFLCSLTVILFYIIKFLLIKFYERISNQEATKK